MKKPYDHLPNQPWVYIFKTSWDKVLYIGKAKDLKKRVKQYFEGSPGVWKEDMIARFGKIDYITTRSEEEAILLENNLIKQYQPPFNSLLKGDTWYVYIKIWWGGAQNKFTKAFPRIYLTRYKESDWAIYIGPKPWKKDLTKTLQFLRQILQFRSCSNTVFNRGKLCIDHDFDLCKGWCVYGKKEFNKLSSEYDHIIKTIKDFFGGNVTPIQDLLLQKIDEAVKAQNFERAARLRDILFYIQRLGESYQTVVNNSPISWRVFLVEVIPTQLTNFILLAGIRLFEGKIIDVLKLKRQEDSLDEIVKQLEREFGRLKPNRINDNRLILSTPDIKSIPEELIDFLETQINQIIASSAFEKQNVMNIVLKDLQSKLGLKNFPYNIEAIDISHLSWDWVSGALIKLQSGIPIKKLYRRYKIHTPWGDDIKSIREIIVRRFLLSKNTNLPDLFLIDGGRAQLNEIVKIVGDYPEFEKILQKVDFIALAKGKARKVSWRHQWASEKVLVLSPKWEIKEFKVDQNQYFKILQKARDEAHRFANAYRKTRMKNEWK